MKTLIIGSVIAVTAAFGLALSCTKIEAGHVGVVKHMGAVQSDSLAEGVHFIRPWPLADVQQVDVRSGVNEVAASAASKDLQVVSSKITVQWYVTNSGATCLVKNFGVGDGLLSAGGINPAAIESVKAVTAQFTAEQLITQRAAVKAGVEQGLTNIVNATINQKGCPSSIKVGNISVTDFNFSEDFNNAIEAKVKAEQEALKAVNEKTKRVTQAEAAATEQKLAAEAEAFKVEIESKARAEAIKRESEALSSNPNLVNLRIAEKWNGQLPTYTGNSIPLLQVK